MANVSVVKRGTNNMNDIVAVDWLSFLSFDAGRCLGPLYPLLSEVVWQKLCLVCPPHEVVHVAFGVVLGKIA
eukprot:1395783-Amphidinium_carterae.1